MKNRAKRTMAAFLAVLMLALAVPFTGILAGASANEEVVYEAKQIAAYDYESTATSLNGGMGSSFSVNTANVNERLTEESGNTYLHFTGKYKETHADRPDEWLFGDWQFGTAKQGGSAFFQSIIADETGAMNAFYKDNFTFEFTLIKNETPFNTQIRLRTDGDMSTFATNNTEGTKFEVLAVIAEDGAVTGGGQTLGNVKEETLNISVVFTYSAEAKVYLQNYYVNGALKIANRSVSNFANVSAEVYHDSPKIGIAQMQIHGLNKMYTNITDTSVTTMLDTNNAENQSLKLTHYGAFDENGNLKYSINFDNLYYTVGSSVPALACNRSVLLLNAGGRTIEGFTAAANNTNLISAPVSAVDGKVELPKIDGVWYDAVTNLPITSVPASAIGTGAVAAYASRIVGLVADTDDFAITDKSHTIKNEDGSVTFNTYLKDETSKDQNLNYYLGDLLKSGIGNVEFMTFKVTFIAESDSFPPLTLRYRNSAWQNSVVSIQNNAVRLADNKTDIPMEIGKEYEVTLNIRLENVLDENGAPKDLRFYVDSYVNGVLYDTMVVYGRSTPTINTNTSTDLHTFQIQLNGGTKSATPQSLTLKDIALYIGQPTYEAPAILSGASIRVGETADDSGLRFSFAADKEWFDSLEGAVAGAIIVPTDKIGELSELTVAALDAAGIRYANETVDKFANESTADTYIYHLSLVKILDKNYARSFTAIGYVKVGDTYYYTGTVSRSVAEVARSYAASGEMTEAHAETVLGFAAKVVYLSDSYEVVAPAGYTSPYAAAYADGKLVISVATVTTGEGDEAVTAPAVAGADVSDILAIVIGDTVYTKGFAAADGTISITIETATEPAPVEPAPEA